MEDWHEPSDLIGLDLVMRGMNGLALLSAVRSQRKSARVLMLSGITSAANDNEVPALIVGGPGGGWRLGR